MEGYYFDENNNFIIENYHRAKTFSSFLPGIAGEAGIPIWSFYVNRGQGISSFGIQDKNNSIMEFFPANGAYQYVSTYGFRTFIKDLSNNNIVYEPFKESFGTGTKNEDEVTTKMTIMKDSFIIEDFNKDNGIHVKVTYSTLSNVAFGGLIRTLELTNVTEDDKDIELIDGMPALLPYGIEHDAYKQMSNLMRSWMEVSHTDTKIPYYKLRSSTKDEAVVSLSDDGYFFMNEGLNDDQVRPIYDPSLVFGYQTDLSVPVGFIQSDYDELMNKDQVFANKVPSAFQLAKMKLKAGEVKTINSIYGYVSDYDKIEDFSKTLNLSEFVASQIEMTKNEVNTLCQDIHTETGIKAFDQYIEQTYLDNILRGGKPLIFEGPESDHVYHVYSRKHGDPERDYNFFSLEPSNYSQGNGNYRDVCQNRRNDVIMDPKVDKFNVWMFYNLVQADGYNPLSIKGTKFIVPNEKIQSLTESLVDLGIDSPSTNQIVDIVKNQYTPGSLMTAITGIKTTFDSKKVLETTLKFASQEIDVDFGEGFWSDHFTYNQDLIDSYEYMYPDKIEATLFDDYSYKFFNAPYYVVPREDKYNLVEDGVVRQYEAIARKDGEVSTWLTNINGEDIKTNLFNKLLILSLTKFMNIDSFALGLEMEGDKPGWNDALNGLPGLMGSGMSESIEIKRTIDYLITSLKNFNSREAVTLLEDISELVEAVASAIEQININELHKDYKESFKLWDMLNDIKETHRENTKYNMGSNHHEVQINTVQDLLKSISTIFELGIEKSIEIGDGIIPSYFVNEVSCYEINDKTTAFGKQSVKALEFKHRPLPFFLEAPTRFLKSQNPETGADLYKNVKASGIYDQGLKMYKTSASLEAETHEIGRIRAFTPGWLERESVFLHMTYKYLLSTLEAGLYDEFYEDIKSNMIPMLSPEVYGRATTENSSFLASSVNPDPSVVGQGFVARLSGSTAEAISMWIKMFIGSQGFEMNDQGLLFTFNPKLSSEFFDENGRITYNLFNTTKVTYINTSGKKTYGDEKATISKITVDGQETDEAYLSSEMATRLRNKEIKEIEVVFK